MSETAGGSSKSITRSAVFSFLLFLSLFLFYGAGAHLLLLAPIILLLANILFMRWPNGRTLANVTGITIRSIAFVAALFALSILWIKLFPSGQVGYGDRLQIDGTQITPLGYAMLSKWSGIFGIFVFGSAILVSLFMRGKDDKSI